MEKIDALCRSWGPAVGRILIGILFLLAGYQKITGLAGFTGFLVSLGVPAASILAIIAVAIEFFGGLMLILGWKTRQAAQVLIVFTIVATYLAHPVWADASQMTMFLKNLALIGGLLYVSAYGAGRWNLEKEM